MIDPAKPHVVFLIGVPGSGKTTFTQSVKDHIVISTDEVIQGVADSLGKTYSEVFSEMIDPATDIFKGTLSLLTYQGVSVIVDRTNLTKAGRSKMIKQIKNRDKYNLVAIILNTPDDIVDQRIAERNKTGKFISKSTMKQMRASYEKPTKGEGFDEITQINFFNPPEEAPVEETTSGLTVGELVKEFPKEEDNVLTAS